MAGEVLVRVVERPMQNTCGLVRIRYRNHIGVSRWDSSVFRYRMCTPSSWLRFLNALAQSLIRYAIVGSALVLFLDIGASSAQTTAPIPLTHRAWTMAAGAPADIWAIKQSPDGFLWLGTGSGLYRFDGVHFEIPKLADGTPFPPGNVTSLLAQKDGTIWAGYYTGGVSRLKDGKITTYRFASDDLYNWVSSIVETPDGAIWAATAGGLYRYDHALWKRVDETWGYDGPAASWALVDPDGTLWVIGAHHLLFLRRNASHFEATNIPTRKYTVIARASSGTLWLSDAVSGVRALPGVTIHHPMGDPNFPVASTETLFPDRVLFDQDGRMWGSDLIHKYLYMLDDPERLATGKPLQQSDATATYDSRKGLTSDLTSPLFEDQQGTLWVGSNLGLDSFRAANAVPVGGLTQKQVGQALMDAAPDGTLWVGALNSLMRVENSTAQLVATLPSQAWEVRAVSEDEAWVFLSGALFHYDHGQTTLLPIVSSSANWHGTLEADGKGGLWAAFSRLGLLHAVGNHLELVHLDGVATIDITAMKVETDGSLYILTPHDGVSYVSSDEKKIVQYGIDGIGTAWSIAATKDRIIVGGEGGVAILVNGQFAPVHALGELPLVGITGIAFQNDDVWLNTSRGVICVSGRELLQSAQSATYHPSFRLFDVSDGLGGIAMQSLTRTIGIGRDGIVAVTTNQGPFLIDPTVIQRQQIPPQVFVRALATDAGSFEAKNGLRLPVGTTRVQFLFTATSLAEPDRVGFRYKLSSVDQTWHDAGHQREATYTNLVPGAYTFEVKAVDENGVWSNAPAAVSFRITPSLFQTMWFKALMATLALALVVMAVRSRLRHLRERLEVELRAQTSERERIARDLHDTLMQSIQALTWRFTMAADDLPVQHPSRASLQSAIHVAQGVIDQGRQRLETLRSSDADERTVVKAVSQINEEAQSLFGTPFVLKLEGQPLPLVRGVMEEIVEIVREAIFNAHRHASASLIVSRFKFENHALIVSVEDNGCGFVKDIEPSGAPAKHFGLTGMYERANHIGAKLEIGPGNTGGTEVRLRVPGRVAYKQVSVVASLNNFLRAQRWKTRKTKPKTEA